MCAAALGAPYGIGIASLAGCPSPATATHRQRVEVDELSTRELHNDEHVENTESDRVLHKEVTSPHALGLVLQEASPGLKIAAWAPFDHVSPDGRGGMADGEFHLQL